MGVMSIRRMSLVAVMSLCAFAGGVLSSAPAALAVAPPVVEEEAVLDVAGTSATFQAKIDPEGSETTYRFEYGTSTAYGSNIPVPDGLVGSGISGVAVSVHPQDLSSSTTYHYRVVALVASRGETVFGGDATFTTQPAGSEFALPDGRQWELVSPPNKHGAGIASLIVPGPTQAAVDGSGIAYGTNVPTELEPQGYGQEGEGFLVQVLSTRGPQGWTSRDIAPPHNAMTALNGYTEYQVFSASLAESIVYPTGEDVTLLSAQATERTPYIRREGLCDSPSTANECYLPILTGKEGLADVPPGTEFGKVEGFAKIPQVNFEGATSDVRHVLLKSEVALTSEPIPKTEMYEWSAGVPASQAVQLVSVLPASEGGGPAQGFASVGVSPGHEPSAARNSISPDGTRIFWLAENNSGGHSLYLRDTAKGETVRLDVQQPGVPVGGRPYVTFQYASSDGSKVFFTDYDQEQRLTPQSGTRGQDLYECEIVEEAGKLKCNLTDLTPETSGKSAEVHHFVLGASEDGSYVYFVANGVLGDGAEHGATQGTCEYQGPSSSTCNLYEYHKGRLTFIRALSADDETDWVEVNGTLSKLTVRVSPNGRYLAFMSDRSLTGYDNRDAVSGHPDMEVYLYDASSNRLVCASCNPTGSRPTGVEFYKQGLPNFAAVTSSKGENWVAANLPPANTVDRGGAVYQPRALFDDGRVFFNSSDALVPQDVNGTQDVYEFEPEGIGSCTASSVTFVQTSGGCVSSVSAGTSSAESGFLDASATGGDVFFITDSRLTSQDYDTAFDVYDAHSCSASVPCMALPVASPLCDSGDSCKAAPSPQPPIFGAPASATFSGAGNVSGSSGVVTVRAKSSTRAQKLSRALKACRKKSAKKRVLCKKQARKRYGAKAAGKTAGAMRKVQG
jgi:hypothetical protein